MMERIGGVSKGPVGYACEPARTLFGSRDGRPEAAAGAAAGEAVVTESARANRYRSSKQVQKTCK